MLRLVLCLEMVAGASTLRRVVTCCNVSQHIAVASVSLAVQHWPSHYYMGARTDVLTLLFSLENI